MKKIIIITLLALFTGATAIGQTKGKGVEFRKGTLKEMTAAAAKENKPLFVDVYATWCGPCKFMTSTIFPQPIAGDYFNSTFVNTSFDGEKGEGAEIARKYGVKAYPTFLILDHNANEVGRLVGGSRTAPEFIERVKEVMRTVK